jgi:signal peptidase I
VIRLVRVLAERALTWSVRGRKDRGSEWGEAILAEFTQVEGSWAAVRWAAGGILAVRRERLLGPGPVPVRTRVFRIALALAAFAGGAVITQQYLFTSQYIPSDAMSPTRKAGDYVLVDLVSFRFTGLKRGDEVLVRLDTEKVPFVKRVLALPGDRIECRGGELYRNGTEVDEPYLARHDTDCSPAVVPDGQVYVLGDNRATSADSRSWGAIPTREIAGRLL